MLMTLAALVPVIGVSVALNGVHVLLIIALSMAAAAAAEWGIRSIEEKRPVMIDGSAGLTGLLLACSLPPQVPLWMAPLGSLFAIAIVKMSFGGRGRNFLNPALAGRAFCVLSFPVVFASAATPVSGETFLNLIAGYQGGWIGGSSAGALLLGAIVLWCLRIIDFTLPLAFIGSSLVLFWLGGEGHGLLSVLLQIGTGGLLLGAFFMATDPVTSPKAASARLLFGTGCGALTFLFRKFGSADNSVMYAVLLMNLMVPYLDRYCGRRPMGVRKRYATN
jgi:Na+-translocating ferredoxin:NAD+ oxidoreductase subunit D